MNKLAFAGVVFMLAAIPFAQHSLDNYKQYVMQQTEVDKQARECANMICFGGPVFFPQLYFDASMQYFLAGLTTGSVGAVFVGLNWRELIK